MAAELRFQYSVNLSEEEKGKGVLNPMQTPEVEDDDSWEVRAFAEDTGSVMGTTWPPRSYTCTYCRREFRSAQALGGHMNVHRRDRARLHQAPAKPAASFVVPPPEFVSNGGLCLFYQFPNPSDGRISSPLNAYIQSHHPLNSFTQVAFPGTEQPAGNSSFSAAACDGKADENGGQELDLELRLGQGPSVRAATEPEERICKMEAAFFRRKSD